MVADMQSQASNFNSRCSHQSVIAITSSKFPEGQIKEEPAKLPEVEVDLTSAMDQQRRKLNCLIRRR